MFCECGCGQVTPVYSVNNAGKGHVKGAHKRFIKGHQCIRNNADSFWDRVDKTGDCWVWTSTKYKFGYGKYSIRRVGHLAHRYSYQLANGPIPKGQPVLHICDNPSCVNPAHLFLGTRQYNMIDKVMKGRQRKGEDNVAKLTEEQVVEIWQSKESQQRLARKYHVSRSAISAIKTQRTWRHLTVGLII